MLPQTRDNLIQGVLSCPGGFRRRIPTPGPLRAGCLRRAPRCWPLICRLGPSCQLGSGLGGGWRECQRHPRGDGRTSPNPENQHRTRMGPLGRMGKGTLIQGQICDPADGVKDNCASRGTFVWLLLMSKRPKCFRVVFFKAGPSFDTSH